MAKNNENQTKNQLQQFDNSSNQLTKKELLLIYGGDPSGDNSEAGDDESG